MTKRAVIYARVSYDDRRNDSVNLHSQLEMGRQYCLEQGYTVLEELAEDNRGASGADFDLPKLSTALEMARAGKFDVLVVRELDRFARGLAKQLVIEQEFKRADVAVEYVLESYDDSPEGQLTKNVRAIIAEYEREKINQRMSRGRRNKVKAGNVMVYGRPPYGYRLVERDGQRALEVCEPEAQVVRMIFRWYTEGDGKNGPIGTASIVRRLNKMNIPTYVDTGTRKRAGGKKKGYGKWARGVVYRMFKNETYIGKWHYGKRTKKNRQRLKNPRDHLLEVQVPAIVSQELWEAVQTRLKNNRLVPAHTKKHQYLLGGRITCGEPECGNKMGGTPRRWKDRLYLYYYCTATKGVDFAHRCDALTFPVQKVDAAVWSWVKSLVSDKKALRREFHNYQAEQDTQNAPLRERLDVIDNLLEKNRSQLQRLVDLYLSGEFAKELLLDRKKRLETTIEALEREQNALGNQLQERSLTTDQLETIEDFATEIAEGLDEVEDDFDKRRHLIQLLDVWVTLVVEGDEKVAYAQCLLKPDHVERLYIASTSTRRKIHRRRWWRGRFPRHRPRCFAGCGSGYPLLFQ